MGVCELNGDVDGLVAPFVCIQKDAATKEAFPERLRRFLAKRACLLAFDRARKDRGHQLEERQKMGTAERAAELVAEPLVEIGIQFVATQRQQP